MIKRIPNYMYVLDIFKFQRPTDFQNQSSCIKVKMTQNLIKRKDLVIRKTEDIAKLLTLIFTAAKNINISRNGYSYRYFKQIFLSWNNMSKVFFPISGTYKKNWTLIGTTANIHSNYINLFGFGPKDSATDVSFLWYLVFFFGRSNCGLIKLLVLQQ